MAVNSFNAQNPPVTTKGDVFTFSTIPTRLGVGANNTVLTADSTTATGLKWAAPAATKNFTSLGTGTLTSGSTVTVSGISNQDQIFVRIIGASSTNASAALTFRINSDSGSNYLYNGIYWQAPAAYSVANLAPINITWTQMDLCGMGSNAAATMSGFISITGGATSGIKTIMAGASGSDGGGNSQTAFMCGGIWNNSATITSISLILSLGTFDAGSFIVYGSA